MTRRDLAILVSLPLALAACQPPAADRYEGRADPPDIFRSRAPPVNTDTGIWGRLVWVHYSLHVQ